MKSLDELDASLLKPGDKLHKYDVIIAGDFNAPNISWDNLDASANLSSSSSSSSSKKLIELTQECNLMQFVVTPWILSYQTVSIKYGLRTTDWV